MSKNDNNNKKRTKSSDSYIQKRNTIIFLICSFSPLNLCLLYHSISVYLTSTSPLKIGEIKYGFHI